MKEKVISHVKRYGISLAVAAAMVALVLFARDYGSMETPVDRYRTMADAFTISAVLMLMVGGLVWISTTGFFDMLSYAMGRFFGAMIPFTPRRDERFYDYKQRKAEKRFSGYGCIFIVGALFMTVAVIFTDLFYTLYGK